MQSATVPPRSERRSLLSCGLNLMRVKEANIQAASVMQKHTLPRFRHDLRPCRLPRLHIKQHRRHASCVQYMSVSRTMLAEQIGLSCLVSHELMQDWAGD